MTKLRKAGSVRVVMTSVIGGVIFGALAAAIWQPLGTPVGIAAAVLAWIGFVMSDDTVAYCPHCSKRVKLGAAVCHHCGRDAVAPKDAAAV